jgi:DNA-binding XRE family transcriptional regulator
MRLAKPLPMPNRLKLLRAEYGIHQWQVAKAIGVSQSKYFQIEAGRTDPSPKEREKLAELFGKPEDDIFTPTVAA